MDLKYDGFVKVYEFEAEVNGTKQKQVKIDFLGAVAAVVVNEDGKLAIVRQFRPTLGSYSYEVPAGLLDKDLSLKDTLLEELHEECNIKNDDIIYFSEEPIISYNMATGVSDAIQYIYLVKIKNGINKTIVNDEVDSLEFMSLEEIDNLINTNIIKDPSTLIGIYKYKDMLRKKL